MRRSRQHLTLLLCLLGVTIVHVTTGADPIHDAASNGDIVSLRRILKEMPDAVNARLPSGATALLWAAIRGQAEAAKTLVEAGADVNLGQGDDWTPLHAAVCDGNDAAHVEITRLLLEHGAKPNVRRQDGWTPLHAAASKGNTATMQILLDKHADVEAADNRGKTPLTLAVEQKQLEAIKLLIANGANPSALDKEAKTPISRALEQGSMQAVAFLLAKVRVTLKLENVSLEEAMGRLLAAAKIAYPVHASAKAVLTLLVTEVPFPIALNTLTASAGGNLVYQNRAGTLEISQTQPDLPKVGAEGASDEAPVLTTDPRFRFTKTISRQVLNNYLSRAVTHYGLCSTSPEPATAYFDDDMRMLTGLGAKFIGRAAYAWVPPDDDDAHFRMAQERAERVHKSDPEIVLQAAVFEAVYESVGKIPVPDWVFTEFNLNTFKIRLREGIWSPGKVRLI
ncbi:MAG: hypothetical protein JWN14_588 [Chthonomonadales bacterium]|nr:hypothetical protein [Chthonomonadales bacterium]